MGLLAIAIPVILHFLNLKKPRQVAFSTIAFFTELQKSTLKRLNLKRLILLAVRSLTLLFLVFALARPFLPAGLPGLSSGGGPILYGLLIDNSPGMDQIDENGPYMDQAKTFAGNMLSQAKSNDQFLIVPTHGESGHARPVNRQEAERLLDAVEVQNKGSYINRNIRHMADWFAGGNTAGGLMFWISHGQKTHINSLEDYGDENVPVQFVKIGRRADVNTAVTAIRTPNQIISKDMPFLVEVEVQNFGDDPVYNQFLSLEMDGTPSGEYQVELSAGQSESFVFEVLPKKTGDLKGLARLEGDAFAFDNKRHFSVFIPGSRNVLLVNDNRPGSGFTSYLKPVLEAGSQTGSQIRFTEVSTGDLRTEDLEEFDAIVLDGLVIIPDFIRNGLQRFVQEGRGLIMFPSQESSMSSYNQFMDMLNAGQFTGLRGDYGRFEPVAGFQQLMQGHPVLDEIFDKEEEDEIRISLPEIYYYWVYSPGNRSSGHTIFSSNLNEPLLTEHQYGNGIFLISSMGAGPGWSGFPANPLFAPLYYRMALYAVSFESSGMAEHILGRPFSWKHDFSSPDIAIELNDLSVRPEAAMTSDGVLVRYDGLEWEPGWADISDGHVQRSIAINQDISESDFDAFTLQELKETLSGHVNLLDVVDTYGMTGDEMSLRIESAGFGSEIWNWFIWLAIVLLLTECLITKKYKAERLS